MILNIENLLFFVYIPNPDDGNQQRSRYPYQSYRENPLDKYNDKQSQHQVDLKSRFPPIQPSANVDQQQIVPKSTSWFNRTSYSGYSQSTVQASRPKFNLTHSNEIEDEITDDFDQKIVIRNTFDNRHPLERFGKMIRL